jgi:hypothetical protein
MTTVVNQPPNPNAKVEEGVLTFLRQHFPTVMQPGHENEKAMLRFLSYVLKFASQQTRDVQSQAVIGAVHGMLNLYGVAGTVVIVGKSVHKMLTDQKTSK